MRGKGGGRATARARVVRDVYYLLLATHYVPRGRRWCILLTTHYLLRTAWPEMEPYSAMVALG